MDKRNGQTIVAAEKEKAMTAQTGGRPAKEGDGCIFKGKLYMRVSDSRITVKDERVNQGMWRECANVPAAVREILLPTAAAGRDGDG